MNRERISAARSLAAVRCAWGATCLARPEGVVGLAGGQPDARALWFARALGGRELAQGLVTLAVPGRRVLTAGVVVDGLHAASALGLAAADATRRRPALLNALAATGWALLGLLPLTRDRLSRHSRPGAFR